MSDFDWIVEYETLPPNDTDLAEAMTPPSKKAPWWPLVLAALGLIGGSVLFYLWQLGAKTSPLPSPQSSPDQLETTIQLEIDAIRQADGEIINRIREPTDSRENIQPPVDWTSNQQSGKAGLEYGNLELVDENNAYASVTIHKDGVPYRVIWFYKKEAGQWIHTEWATIPILTLRSTFNHVNLQYISQDLEQAARLGTGLNNFIIDYCRFFRCPGDPFSVTVELDPYKTQYQVERKGSFSYSIPSPMRVRWPEDNSPEPLIYGSLSRKLAYDLGVKPIYSDLSADNSSALTLALFWYAHHSLSLDTLPSTQWLDKAAEIDGMEAARTFIELLSINTTPNLALTSAFKPATIKIVSNLPDFYAWLVTIHDNDVDLYETPANLLSEQPWQIPLVSRFDELADPWAPSDMVYEKAVPQITDVIYPQEWAIALAAQPTNGWLPLYFIKFTDNDWILTKPADYPLGQPEKITTSKFTLSYWPWERTFAQELVEILTETHNQVGRNFQLAVPPPDYVIAPGFKELERLENPNTIPLSSPTSQAWDTDLNQTEPRLEAIMNTLGYYLKDEIQNLPEEATPLLVGLYLWQIEQIAARYPQNPIEIDLYSTLPDIPDTIESENWLQLDDLWSTWDQDTLPADIANQIYYSQKLVEFLTQQSSTIAASMLKKLETSKSMVAWIYAISGQSIDQVEEEWKEWMLIEKSG